MKLAEHHEAWLSAHPDRTAAWLKELLKEGFDVHHVDGDDGNNSPRNLILIEAADHMRLHGPALLNGITGWRRRLAAKSMAARMSKVELVPQRKEDGEADFMAYQSRVNGLRSR